MMQVSELNTLRKITLIHSQNWPSVIPREITICLQGRENPNWAVIVAVECSNQHNFYSRQKNQQRGSLTRPICLLKGKEPERRLEEGIGDGLTRGRRYEGW